MPTIPSYYKLTQTDVLQRFDLVVPVVLFTSDQERLVDKCLNGILTQQTNFRFEVIVIDRGSTDATCTILHEYAAAYPEQIRVYMSDLPTGTVDVADWNVLVNSSYVVLCDGAEEWISPVKLQRQVDFLQLHSSYCACLHDVYIQGGRSEPQNRLVTNRKGEDFLFSEIDEQRLLLLPSVAIRLVAHSLVCPVPLLRGQGALLFAGHIQKGKIRCLSPALSQCSFDNERAIEYRRLTQQKNRFHYYNF